MGRGVGRVRVLPLLAVLALAGCAEPPPPAALPLGPPEPSLVTEPVDWQATLAPSYCVNGPVLFACGGGVFVNGWDSEPAYLHDTQGRDLAGGNLALEWEPATPTTTALGIAVYVLEGCPDECAVNRTLTSTAGESPLPLEVDARPMDDGHVLAVQVRPLFLTPTVRATLQQDIHLAGSLAFVEASDDAPAADEADEDEDEQA